MGHFNQRTNLAISFAIILVTAIALFVVESVEIFAVETPIIHNDIALAALDSCKQASKECTCTVTEQCDTCPPSYPLPPECRVTGRREHVKCSPGDHEFYQQCKRTGGDEARKNSFWVFYLSSGIMLIGSVVAVNHRKQFLDYSNSVRLEEM